MHALLGPMAGHKGYAISFMFDHQPGRFAGTGAPRLTERAKLDIDLPRPRSIADTDAWTTDDLGEL